MSEEIAPVVVVAIEISDSALADRLASLLGGVTGIRLATPGEAAVVALVSCEAQGALEPADIELTPRERDVLVLMAEGASNKAIARRLGISVHTAKSMSARCSTSLMPPAGPMRWPTRRGLG